MQTLDQTLLEVEPIFRDGTFVMPSFQEVLTARQFADEINSGALSVRDAFFFYWSYYKDKESWELEHPTELEDLEESDYNQPRTLDGWGNTLLFTFEMLDKRRALKLVGVINQTNVPLETKIEFLDLLVTKRRLIGSSTYVREFLEISRQIYKQYQEHKIRGIDYVLLQDGLRDTLFKFVLPENEIGHKATWEIMAGRRKPTKEYFELVGVISREMESAPEGLRSFYARVIKFIKPEKGAQTTSMDNYDIPF